MTLCALKVTQSTCSAPAVLLAYQVVTKLPATMRLSFSSLHMPYMILTVSFHDLLGLPDTLANSK